MEQSTSSSAPQDSTMLTQPTDSASATRSGAAKTNYLMTPEEQCASTFSPTLDDAAKTTLPPIHGLQSPPTSPAFRLLPDIASVTGISPSPRFAQPDSFISAFRPAGTSAHSSPDFRDDALFPSESDRAHRQSPLFQHDEVTALPRPRDTAPLRVSQPLSFIKTPQQAYDYWRRCYDDVARMGRVLPRPSTSATSSRDAISVRQLQSIEHAPARTARATTQSRSHRVVKPAVVQERAPTAAQRRVSRQKARAATPATPTLKGLPDADKGSKHRRAAASKPRPVNEHWTDIPDFCPPLESLDTAGARTLKARPVGSSPPRDLSRDADREHLHPAELAVAAILRLECGKYLLNKRKIFRAKVEHLRAARAAASGAASGTSQVSVAANFNKTEAQKACTIDVNKASALFGAFEDVGWFREEWFEKYL